MKKIQWIQQRDLLTVGIYMLIYFVLTALSGMVTVLIVPGYSYLYIPIVVALMTGSIFMMSCVRVPRLGAITLLGFGLALFYLISGRFPGAFLPIIATSLMADGVAYLGHYRKRQLILPAYIIFSMNTIWPIFPLLTQNKQNFIQDLVRQGRSQEYIDQMLTMIPEGNQWMILLGIVISAVIGGLLGLRMMRRHFTYEGTI